MKEDKMKKNKHTNIDTSLIVLAKEMIEGSAFNYFNSLDELLNTALHRGLCEMIGEQNNCKPLFKKNTVFKSDDS